MMPVPNKIFIYGEEFEKYPYPEGCPFNSSRAGKTRKNLMSLGLLHGNDRGEVVPVPAERELLEKFHTSKYLDILQKASRREMDYRLLEVGLGTDECPIFDGLYHYAALACGATVAGARTILTGNTRVAFNPSGGFHHAHPEKASGFCYINDIVLGCMVLAEAGKRILFLDIDAHHSDGVQSAFYDREDIMVISMHESGKTLFPGTGFVKEMGRGKGTGYTVNIPLPENTYDEAYLKVYFDVVAPLIRKVDPDVLVLEIGADGLAGDPLTHLNLTNNVYVDIINDLLTLNLPILATGGGGYHVENTVRAWALCWATLCGDNHHDDMMSGLGGVMLESMDWLGGFRDRVLIPDQNLKQAVDREIQAVIDAVKRDIYPYHGIA